MPFFNRKPRPNPYATCAKCGHVCDRATMKAIDLTDRYSSFGHRWYCREHAPVYDSVSVGGHTLKPTYYRKMQVDQHGDPIGYKKAKA